MKISTYTEMKFSMSQRPIVMNEAWFDGEIPDD